EAVPLLDKAISICKKADVLFIIGTSMQVYPAASLIHDVPQNIPIYFIDPNPAVTNAARVITIAKPATIGVAEAIQHIAD
ncbi:MAG: NAD-dependent deacylase, partial [Oceanihabitans sp.]